MTRCPHCQQAIRNAEGMRARAKVLEALRPGKWVHGPKLSALVYPGRGSGSIRHLIARMREEGYEIEGEQLGTSSRGYRLISEPDAMTIAA